MNNKIIYLVLLAAPILGFFCARGAKGLGQKIAVTRLTKPMSVIESISRQMHVFGRAGLLATILVVAGIALMLFAPSSALWWAGFASTALGFGANLALGLSAGVGGHVAEVLEKISVRDTLLCLIEMKRRTRRHLQKFLTVTTVALAILAGQQAEAASERVWVWAIDESDSVDPGQRELGVQALIHGAYDRAHDLGADVILIIKFSDEVLLSDMTWVRIPRRPHLEDCRRTRPQFTLTEGLASLSPFLALGRKQNALEACLSRQVGSKQLAAEGKGQFEKKLQLATRARPRSDGGTWIIPLLMKLLARLYACAIEILTDGVDNSGLRLSDVKVPKGIPVTLVITRPNPRRKSPTLDQVLSAAEAWVRVPGIAVTSVSEYSVFSHATEGR